MKKCSKCGFTTENEEIAFCVKCGNKLENDTSANSKSCCPKCGKINPDENAFCMYCGAKLISSAGNADYSTEAENTDALKKNRLSKTGSRKIFKTALTAFVIAAVSTAAVFGTVYAVKNDLFSAPTPVQNFQTVDKQYNIKGKFCASIDGVIYYLDEDSILCAAESEKGIRTISSSPVSDVISDGQYIYYISDDGLFSLNTYDGALVADTTDDLVSVAKMQNENEEAMLTIDKNGNIYSFTGNLSDISIRCKSNTQAVDTPKLFSGAYVYAFYNDRMYLVMDKRQQNMRKLNFNEYFVACENTDCYYLSDGLWMADKNIQHEKKIIDSADITEICYGGGYIALNYNGICIINTKDDSTWRLSDQNVSGLCIDGKQLYFTSKENGLIYSVPIEGGDVVALTYYMIETVQ